MQSTTAENTATIATTSNETVHVLLTYVEGDSETYCNLFRTKDAVIAYVLDGIKKYWEEIHWEEDITDEDYEALDKEQAEAEKAMNEHGWWKDREGNTYCYEEREFTA